MLGARIAALRRHAGLSQAQLARRLQISASAMGMYEQGRREPSADTLVAIARELQVSTDFLLTGKEFAERDHTQPQIPTDGITPVEMQSLLQLDRPFSRQELAVLFAALLMET